MIWWPLLFLNVFVDPRKAALYLKTLGSTE